MADRELSVCRGVACAEARAAEALADDCARRSDLGQRAVLHQLDVGGHASRIDAHFEFAVAAAPAAQDIRDRAYIVKCSAGAARNQTLIHPDFAAANLAHQIKPRAGNLRVGFFLTFMQNIRRVCLQLGDGIGIARVHRQGDGTFNRGKIDINAAVVIGDLCRLEFLIGFRTVVNRQIILRVLVGYPDGGPAGRFGGHHVDAVAVFNRQISDTRADEFHDLILDIALGVDRADDGERDILRADAVLRLSGQINGDHARTGDVIGAPDELLGELAAAFADGKRAQRAIAGMAV